MLFSTGGAGLKTDSFTSAEISALRSGLAALFLLVWMRGRVSWTRGTVGAGILYAATVTLFVAATKLTTAASAIFLQSSAPLFIVLLGPPLLGERFERRDVRYLVVIAAGLILCFLGRPHSSGTAPDPVSGNILALFCSVTWALTLLALRYHERQGGAERGGLSSVVIGNLFACVVALPFAWPFPAAPAAAWATMVYLGTLQIGLAYICLTAAVRQVPAFEISLLLLVEPVLNPIWTWLIRGEEPGGAVIAGGAVILAATAARSFRTDRPPAPMTPAPPAV